MLLYFIMYKMYVIYFSIYKNILYYMQYKSI